MALFWVNHVAMLLPAQLSSCLNVVSYRLKTPSVEAGIIFRCLVYQGVLQRFASREPRTCRDPIDRVPFIPERAEPLLDLLAGSTFMDE